MKLTIKSVEPGDYGAYKCISRNSLGETDGTIKVYRKYLEHHSFERIIGHISVSFDQ